MVQQREAVGHAVRAAYMYAGMVDVAALQRDPAYREAVERIWEDVVVAEAVPDRRPRRAARRRGLRGRVRAAEPHRLRRDLRVDRGRVLEPPHVPAHGRRALRRRARAHALQRRPRRRLAARATPSSIRTRSSPTAARRSTREPSRASRGSTAPAARRTSRASSPRCPTTSTPSAGDALYVNLYVASEARRGRGRRRGDASPRRPSTPGTAASSCGSTPAVRGRSSCACASRAGREAVPCRAISIATSVRPARRPYDPRSTASRRTRGWTAATP